MRRQLRFKLRWMMIVVAILAFAIGAVMTRRRGDDYRERASRCANLESAWRVWVERWDRRATEWKLHVESAKEDTEGFGTELPDGWEQIGDMAYQNGVLASERAEYCRRVTAYFGSLKRKYERAALRPWLPVEPDPPKPEP